MNTKPRSINANEFDWLGYCTSCNVDCCHNRDPFIHKYECIKPGIEKGYKPYVNSSVNKDLLTDKLSGDIYDNRPIECQIFPFDVMELDGRLEWVKRNHCHATPELNYEKFMNFFERQFSKKWSLEEIKQYVAQDKENNPEKYSANNFVRIKEVKWRDS